jgi:thiosulfate/3-mercaptopyruvate sulfurtransferase
VSLASVTQLAGHLDSTNLRIVDARAVLSDPQAGLARYKVAHIPGARYVDLNADLSAAKIDPRQGRHPLPGAGQFSALLSRLGITPETEVVVYDQADGAMAASRFWFLMRLAGHTHVSVLDGGMDAWLASGLPTASEVEDIVPTVYPVVFNNQMLVTESELKALLNHHDDTVLIDARAAERYRGEVEPLDKKAGHIPGALNRPYAQNLENGVFKTSEQLRAEFEPLVQDRKNIILSCGSGVTACHNALAMSYAAIEAWRLFAPSWSGWVADDANPIATGDQ